MRLHKILALVCISLVCAAAASAQDDLYGRIKPLETAVKEGTATSQQELELARLYVSAGRFHEANKLATRILAGAPDDEDVMKVRDEALRGLREANAKAVSAAEARARAAGAGDADRLALANSYFDAGSYRAAAETYATLPASMVDRDLRLKHARALAWSNQMDAAERVYTDLLREGATPEIELEYGRLLSWMGASRVAHERLQSAYRATPTDDAAVALANAMAWSGDREGAIVLLERHTGEYKAAPESRALLLQLRSSPEIRLERIDKLIALEPYNLALRMSRARLQLESGNYGDALKNIRFVREHARQPVEGLEALEKEATDRRDAERARLQARRAELDARSPATPEETLSLAKSYTAIEDYDEATRLYENYLRERPDDLEARLAYARVLSWDRRWTASQRQYARILDASPERADVRLEYAQVLSYGEDYADAIHMFSSLTDLSANPRAHLYSDVPSRAHYNLGQIYRWFGWNEHAIDQQNRALQLDGSYFPAREELDVARHVRPASNLQARYTYSTDSNDFTLQRVDLEAEKWTSQRTAWSVALGRHNFEHFNQSVDATSISGGLTYRWEDRWLARGRVGGTFYDDELGARPFWGVGAEWLPSIQSRAALDYNHYDLVYDVFTLTSLGQDTGGVNINFNDPISIDDFRGHYDYNTGGFWAFLGDASYGFISDDNRRAAAHGVVSFRVLRSPFVAIKADGRWLSYDFRTNRYWSPTDYTSLAGVLQIGQNVRDKFFWTVEGKYGRSYEGNRESDLRSYSARVTVPVTDAVDLVGHYSYGKSGRIDSVFGDSNTDFVNYWQRSWYVGIRLRQLFAGSDRRGADDTYYFDNRMLTGSPVVAPVGETR